MKTKVEITDRFATKFDKGDKGYIDGYVINDRGEVLAIVIVDKYIDFVDINNLEVINN